MSELEHVLKLFGFMSIDDVTAESLKKAFKIQVLKSHPDKGGDATEFDRLLGSFVYLSETFQRINGGRATLQNVISPDILKGMRPDELVNRVFEEFDNDAFNKMFEENHKRQEHGYVSWLKNEDELTNLTEGRFGNATQRAPTFDEKDLQKSLKQPRKKINLNLMRLFYILKQWHIILVKILAQQSLKVYQVHILQMYLPILNILMFMRPLIQTILYVIKCLDLLKLQKHWMN